MPLEIVRSVGNDSLARVFVARLEDGAHIELVESVQPPVPRDEKWVLIVSTLRGCPVGCVFCDAGGHYSGRLSAEEIHAQIEFLVRRRYPDGVVPVSKLKIQFARMGEPAFNDAVLDVLRELPSRLDAPGLMPSISTVAPRGRDAFFASLAAIKDQHYGQGRFQMQFSLHTTSEEARRALVPVRTWTFAEMAAWGDRFYADGDRKITLNFAAVEGQPLEPDNLLTHFSPARYAVKLTPVNPTEKAEANGVRAAIDAADAERCQGIVDRFRTAGFDTILSIGELDENRIGSNCGMFVGADGGLDVVASPETPLV